MMNRTYDDWIISATEYRKYLDDAINSKNPKDILYYRGKYLFALKQAHKLNSSAVLPRNVTGYSYDTYLADEIKVQLENHKRQIEVSLSDNKKQANIKSTTLIKELGLKIRRLSTRATQINFATNATEKQKAIQNTVHDSAGLLGTVVKSPIMATAKVVSAVGPLVITIGALPLNVFASLLAVTIDLYNGKVASESTYNNTVVNQLSNTLKDGIKQLTKVTYESIGRI